MDWEEEEIKEQKEAESQVKVVNQKQNLSEQEIFTYNQKVKLIMEILNLMNKIRTKLQSLRKYLQVMQVQNRDIGGIYNTMIKQMSEVYNNNFQIIQKYGEFYQIYQKVNSFLNQIMLENQQSMEFIKEEIATQHYKSIELKANNIMLNQFSYLTGNQIQNIQELNFNNKEPSQLDCRVNAVIDTSFLKINSEIDLKLVVNNKAQDIFEKQSFNYGPIKTSQLQYSEIIYLHSGINNIKIFARVKNSDIKLKSLNVNCLEFIQYQDIPSEYLLEFN